MDEMPLIEVLWIDGQREADATGQGLLGDAPRCHVTRAQSLDEALAILADGTPPAIVLDLGLPESQGLSALRTLRSKHRHVAIVVLIDQADDAWALLALKAGAQDCLAKGELQAGSFERAIRYAVERSGFEKTLRQSEERFQELTAHLQQVLWMIDAKAPKILYVSPGYEKIWGRTCQSLIDDPKSYLQGIHLQDREKMVRAFTALVETGYIDVGCRVVRPDESVRWIWIRGYPVIQQGEIVRLVGIVEDVTEKRRLVAERDVLLSRHQLHIERMPLAYVLFDANFRIVDWNSMAERIFGYSKAEMLGQGPPLAKIVPQSFWEQGEEIFARIRSGDMDSHSTNDNLTKDGRTITCEWFNTPLFDDGGLFTGMLCLAQDATGRRLLEAQLQHAQKMESIGHLAGGVAHDFNNLLTIIVGCCDALESNESLSELDLTAVHDIDDATKRAAVLTRQLLAFSRKQLLEPMILNLNEVVDNIHKMLLRLINEDIELSSSLFPALWPVRLDQGQIEQVLVNLVVNARDAMPGGGRLTITTSNIEWTAEDCRLSADRKPGRYVTIVVADTGAGVTPEIKSRMFDPFFTTKEAGKGTGLGLAVVHGIVTQSDGYIDVDSEPGVGTSMKLYFPAVRRRLTQSIIEKDKPPTQRGSETILLVEDEEGVRELVRRNLERQGYTVLDANNGQQAVNAVEGYNGPLHLIITDVVMPVMGGRQLVDRLLNRYPNLKVLYVTGYTDDAILRKGIDVESHALLQKPFSPADLTRKVRIVLDADACEANLA